MPTYNFIEEIMNSATLILTNGKKFTGKGYNLQSTPIYGEVVFNTGMTGYEETLTDPSYSGQILVFTYPLLGNYGVSHHSRWESKQIHVKGIICENIITDTTHHKCHKSFHEWLKEHHIPIISEIDTRELTKTLRDTGTMNGVISSNHNLLPIADLFNDTGVVEKASCNSIQYHGIGKYQILLVDFGVKHNIIRNLLDYDVTIKQVPYNYDYSNEKYDGILLSNGPGDPKACVQSIAILKKAIKNNTPIFGICLGAQLLALAAGANTYKLRFGHRGQNQPCQDTISKRCYLTSQNHGYAIAHETLPIEWDTTFINLHDNSIAGIKHKSKPFSAVQFHPEASPGPHDTKYLFANFMQLIIGAK